MHWIVSQVGIGITTQVSSDLFDKIINQTLLSVTSRNKEKETNSVSSIIHAQQAGVEHTQTKDISCSRPSVHDAKSLMNPTTKER